MPRTRLNFTAAQSLGHWLIDSKKSKLWNGDVALPYPIASNVPTIREQLANYFASAY